MTFEGAVVREQGVSFAIVIVKYHVIQNRSEWTETISSFRRFFSAMPIILMGQDSRGMPTYVGRSDIVRFMANVRLSRVPWKRFTVGE